MPTRSPARTYAFLLTSVVLLAVCVSWAPAAEKVNDPETITKDQAKQQIEKAAEVLVAMGFGPQRPDFMATYGVTIGEVWHNQPQWWMGAQSDGWPYAEVGKIAWRIGVKAFLSPQAAKNSYDEYLSREKGFQQFLTTSDGSGSAGVRIYPQAWFRCGNIETEVEWVKGLPPGTEETEAFRQEGLSACRQMATRLHDAFAAKGVCGAAGVQKADLDDPIPPAAIDRYLDLLGAKLTAARDQASVPTLDPLAPPTGPFSYDGAAQMAIGVWAECQGLIKAHIDRRLILNEGHKNRIKAFGWWADWIVQRAAHPYRLNWKTPDYPLLGPVNATVPTPPQYKGEDILVVSIPYWGPEAITGDYAWATAATGLRVADIYYTGGWLYTAYLACTSDSLGEVALAALTSMPYVGKWVSAALCTYVEGNAVYSYARDGVNPLTWDQHVANICALTNMGLQAYKTFSPNATRANPVAGVDEGNLPVEVTTRFNGKSFELGPRTTKRLASGQDVEVAEASYAVVGPYRGKQAQGLVAYEKRPVAILKDAEGNARYFGLDGDKLGDPIFFLGEKGYHIWSHLTEIKSGHQTGFRSVKDVCDDRPDFKTTLTQIEKTMRDPRGDLKQAQEAYVGFVNRLIDDGSFEKMQGFYQYTTKRADGSRSPVGRTEANTFVRIPRPTTDPNQVTHYPVRISIDPSTGKLMNVFVITPKKPSEQFMSEALAESLRKHFSAWNDSDKVVFSCPELSTILGPSSN